MIGGLVLGVLIILYIAFYKKESKFREIERQQQMRRAMLKLHDNHRRFSH